MIYLDNAATSFPKPPEVAQAMSRFLSEAAGNPGRSGHQLAAAAARMIDDTRHVLTRIIGGDNADRMIFTLNATDALNMAIHGVLGGYTGKATPHVVTTVLEHNSVSRPLEALARSGQIKLTRVDCDDGGFVDPEDIAAATTERTVLVAMTHASNVLGTLQNVAAVGKMVCERGALFLLDAAQTMGVVEIDVEAMGVDLLAFPGHKGLLGPTGTGGLYVGGRCPAPMDLSRSELARTPDAPHPLHTLHTLHVRASPDLQPWRQGGTGGDSSHPVQPAEYPAFLEAGTPNTVGLAGLAAAVANVDGQTIRQRLAHEQALCARLVEQLAGDERFILYGSPEASRRVGTVAMNVRGVDPADVATILDDSFAIAVRAGLHCAPYIHRRMGTFPDGAVRVSVGPYTQEAEIDQLINALQQIAA